MVLKAIDPLISDMLCSHPISVVVWSVMLFTLKYFGDKGAVPKWIIPALLLASAAQVHQSQPPHAT